MILCLIWGIVTLESTDWTSVLMSLSLCPNAVCELQPQWAQVLIHSPTLKNSPGHPSGS